MPRIPLIPTLAVLAMAGPAFAVDLGSTQFHGFASQGYVRTQGELYDGNGLWGRNTNRGIYEFNEFALNAVANPADRLRIGIQVNAYDLGKYGNDQVGIDWAFGEYQVPTGMSAVNLSLVAGRFKTGHGLYNDYRDLDVTRTSVFLPRACYPTSFRDFYLAANGGQVNASLSAGALGSFDLSGFIGTQNIDEDEGPILDIFRMGIAQASPTIPGLGSLSLELNSFDSISLDRFNGGYFTWNTPVDGLRLKVSTLYAHRMRAEGGTVTATLPVNPVLGAASGASATTDIDVLVHRWFETSTGAEYQIGNLTIASELISQYYKAENTTGALDFPATGFPGPFPPASVDRGPSTTFISARTTGAYLSATCQLPAPLNQFSVFGAGNWERNVSNSGAKSFTRSAVVALRFDVVDHFLIKGEFERVQDTDAAGEHMYGNVFSLKTTFDF